MRYCIPNDQICGILNPNPKSCIECIYIKHYGAKDKEELYAGIRKMFRVVTRQ